VTMQVYRSLTEVPLGFGPSAVSIGKFDGVHAGHRGVIAELRSMADVEGLVAVAVTFDRHPLALLNPAACPEPLVSNEQKLELLADTGIDATLMLEFNLALSQQSPEEFATSVLAGSLNARIVFVGSDFRFGAKGAGTVETLVALGETLGFEVRLIDSVVAPVGGAHRRASSTWVRELLAEGRVAEAAEVLGRAPTVRGEVVGGEHRGRELGYPTANLSREREGLVPADGVYAARVLIDGQWFGAAVSIGNNPTFEGVPDKQVEAHVLDEKRDLYGKVVDVEFIEYIRPMKKFPDADALVVQMHADEEQIREVLGQPHP
jgi:riboflavin kinase / FMN adenylyltransferase